MEKSGRYSALRRRRVMYGLHGSSIVFSIFLPSDFFAFLLRSGSWFLRELYVFRRRRINGKKICRQKDTDD